MKFVCLWSGPRNVSTALMYSFAQRDDTVVIDEPLYGHYLRVSGAQHPGRDLIIAALPGDGDTIMREIVEATYAPHVRVVFIKQMAHHLVGIDRTLLQHDMHEITHAFLIRDPREMLPSLTVQLPHASLADTAFATQWELFNELADSGKAPAVVDSRELLLNPETVLTRLCERLAIPFTPAMLHWPAGARPEDGIWARHWYDAVHRSTGFDTHRPKPDLPDALQPLFRECNPYYLKLVAHAIRA